MLGWRLGEVPTDPLTSVGLEGCNFVRNTTDLSHVVEISYANRAGKTIALANVGKTRHRLPHFFMPQCCCCLECGVVGAGPQRRLNVSQWQCLT